MSERLEQAIAEFLSNAIENCYLSFNQLEDIKEELKWINQYGIILKKLLKENDIIFPVEKFFDKCILLGNRQSEFTYLSGLQDGIEFTKKIEEIKENMMI